MKPFAFASEFKEVLGEEGNILTVGGVVVSESADNYLIDLQTLAKEINSAFESRLKEELEKFRGRAISKVFGNCDNDNVAQRTADAIRALPLFEEE